MQGNVNKIIILLTEDSKREAFYENIVLKSRLFPSNLNILSASKAFFSTVMLVTKWFSRFLETCRKSENIEPA